jgi:hypothetical protein
MKVGRVITVGDLVQVKQQDVAIVRTGEEPQPMVFWIYATVLEILDGALLVEIAHPGNITHGVQKKVSSTDIRTLADVQELHDAHPAKAAQKLDFNRHDHRELNNLRVAIDRMTPKEAA